MFAEFTVKLPKSLSEGLRRHFEGDLRISVNPKSVAWVSPINDGGTSIGVMVGVEDDTIIAVQESYEEVVENLTTEFVRFLPNI